MNALPSFQYTGMSLGVEPNGQDRLSRRSALFAVTALSLLSWAVVLIPLWAVIHSLS